MPRAAEPHTMKRWLLDTLIVLTGAAILTGAAAWVWLRPQQSAFYTDADTIRVPRSSVTVREVLWQPPRPLVGAPRLPHVHRGVAGGIAGVAHQLGVLELRQQVADPG